MLKPDVHGTLIRVFGAIVDGELPPRQAQIDNGRATYYLPGGTCREHRHLGVRFTENGLRGTTISLPRPSSSPETVVIIRRAELMGNGQAL